MEWINEFLYAIEKSVVNTLPFRSNFNIGNGYNFFINGENPGMNTQSYTIETSLDGVTFTLLVEVPKNQLGNTVDTFKATQAKYVKINVLKPSQGADSAVRIYGIDVFGIEELL